MKDQILQAHRLVEWLEFEEEPLNEGKLMGKDSNCQGHSGPILITTPNERLYTVRLSLIPGNRLDKRIAQLSLS